MKWQIRGVSPGHKSSGDTGRLSDVIREERHLAAACVYGGAYDQGSATVQDRERPSGGGDTTS